MEAQLLLFDSVWYQFSPKGEMRYVMSEILTEAPDEGDDQEAAEGTDEVRVEESELEDAPELEDSDEDESPDS